jgi:hypothetical protein
MDDRAVLADEPVEQRRLADVGATDDGDARCVGIGRRPLLLVGGVDLDRLDLMCFRLREPVDDHVEQIAGAAAVQGAHRVRLAEAERHELPAFLLAAVVVGLVRDHDDV